MAKRLSNQDKLKRYRQDVEFAVKWRSDAGFDQLWHDIIDMYRGRMYPDASTGEEDRVAINVAFSTMNVIYPSVSVNHPKITIFANQPEDEDRAVIAEAIMGYWWGHFDFHEPFRLSVKDFLMLGIGWAKVGWKYEEEAAEYNEDDTLDAFYQAREQADAYAAANPQEAASLPTDDEIMASVVDSGTTAITEDRPVLDRVSPFNMYVNAEATCWQDVRWVAQRIIMSLEDAQDNKHYSPSARKKLKARAFLDASWLTQEDKERYSDQTSRVIVWEHYDLRAGTLCIFADGSDEYLVSPMKIPFSFGCPFIPLLNFTVPDQFLPIGDLEMIIPMNDELNKLRSQIMNYRKKAARKYLYRDQAFDPRARALLASDEDNVAVPVLGDGPLMDQIIPMPITQLPPEIFQYSDFIKTDMYEVSGVSEYQRGGGGDVRRTATEAALINNATNARSAEKLSIVEHFIQNIARKLLQVGQQFLTGDQVARVVGRDGQQMWVPYEADDILGEYDFKCEAGSTQPIDENTRRQNAIGLMQTMAPFMQMGVLNPIELARHVLREGFGVRNPEKFMMPQAQEMLAMQQQAQAQQLQQQTMQGQAATDQAGAEAQQAQLEASQGQGVDAPQMPPEELLARQQGAVPTQEQLRGQVGLQLQ